MKLNLRKISSFVLVVIVSYSTRFGRYQLRNDATQVHRQKLQLFEDLMSKTDQNYQNAVVDEVAGSMSNYTVSSTDSNSFTASGKEIADSYDDSAIGKLLPAPLDSEEDVEVTRSVEGKVLEENVEDQSSTENVLQPIETTKNSLAAYNTSTVIVVVTALVFLSTIGMIVYGKASQRNKRDYDQEMIRSLLDTEMDYAAM